MYLNRQSLGEPTAPVEQLDPNGDQLFDAVDILFAISDLNERARRRE